jgi:hypothetical protein
MKRTSTGLAAVALALGVTASCSGSGARQEDRMTSRTIEDVLATHTDSLMALPSVVGTAIGLCDGVPCIRVLVSDSSAASRRQIPDRLDGYPVRVDVTGSLRALDDTAQPRRVPP